MPRKKIIEDKDTGYQFHQSFRNRGIDMIDDMSKRHSRVMQTRMDFRYPENRKIDGSNKDFSDMLHGLMKELKKEKYDPRYIGRREQKKQPHQHYHLNLFTNAEDHECRAALIEKAERHWGNALGLTQQEVHERQLVYPCNTDRNGAPRPNGYILARGAENYEVTRQDMIRQMGYLTKADTRDTTPTTTRKFFTSETRKKKME